MNRTTGLPRRTMIAAALACAAGSRLAFGQTASGSANRGEEPGMGEKTGMRIHFRFGTHVFTAVLEDNPSSRDLLSLLPADLTIDDYSSNEKIAYLPRKLTEAGSGPFGNEAVGDLCYYAPWGNLAFFYAGYRYSRGLIRLGRLEGGTQPLLTRGKFPLRAERLG
ncbi:cyclophilin-like fold protein [Azospirillum sp. TSH100]|uniref:cyclophilin-like fold protein n=1 Tax=Azospirillum sp. TSH100 TaxID=652764 RepID=UPI00145BAD9D|nr:cyclophilin-like fold protein [Azospirillum sp. TSH100]